MDFGILGQVRICRADDLALLNINGITAKCLGVDEKGRVKMSRRAWLRDQKAAEAEAAGRLRNKEWRHCS